jgi:hypothetical protein
VHVGNSSESASFAVTLDSDCSDSLARKMLKLLR